MNSRGACRFLRIDWPGQRLYLLELRFSHHRVPDKKSVVSARTNGT
jgi:hypothetical protein